jgi:hypothetical protein
MCSVLTQLFHVLLAACLLAPAAGECLLHTAGGCGEREGEGDGGEGERVTQGVTCSGPLGSRSWLRVVCARAGVLDLLTD